MKEKTIKLRKRDLARLVRGDLTLNEARKAGLIIETTPTPQMQQTDPTMYQNDSLDAQIDKFLLEYDPGAEQTTVAAANEAFLREAGEEAVAAPAADPNAGKPPQPAKKLDMMSFASDVARLVEKSDMLLDVKGTIVRRALNYITKNYDPKQAKDVAQILENNFGVSSEPGSDPYEDESAPFAVGAGATGVQQGG